MNDRASVLDADVGIVGAGPAGMAAADALAAAGLSVVLLDEIVQVLSRLAAP